ncbi:hypothetical protein [Bdellovibrio sp. HCB337]|uniref:hypothetical protein n=1 Tax=Bdellovibrio sp. HCB337 TaxID=3394358 RepID=UPI0039A645F8
MAPSFSIFKGIFLPVVLSLALTACGNVKFHAETEQKVDDNTPGSVDDNDNGGATPTPTATPPGGTPTPTVTPPGGTPTPTVTPPGSTPTPTPTPASPRTVTYSQVVPANPNKVDLLLVIDDSGSMKTDQLKLASKLSGFATQLESQSVPMDWQMCVTVTRDQKLSDGKYYWGASVNWEGYSPAAGTPRYVLKKGTSGLNDIFTKTINAIGAGVAGSGDERGIKAAYHHFYNGEPGAVGTSGCYRKDAAVAVIVISDEDERSVGGDCSRIKSAMREDPATCKALEPADMPNTLLTQAKSMFGANVRFTFNSIVVADSSCESVQDNTADEKGEKAPSHQGTKYMETSRLTNGGIGSICASDFSTNLNVFKDKILNSLSTLTLECAPVAGTLSVAIDGASTTDYTLSGASLKFNNAIVEGKRVTMTYKCNN